MFDMMDLSGRLTYPAYDGRHLSFAQRLDETSFVTWPTSTKLLDVKISKRVFVAPLVLGRDTFLFASLA